MCRKVSIMTSSQWRQLTDNGLPILVCLYWTRVLYILDLTQIFISMSALQTTPYFENRPYNLRFDDLNARCAPSKSALDYLICHLHYLSQNRVGIMVASGLMPIWRQNICYHYEDSVLPCVPEDPAWRLAIQTITIVLLACLISIFTLSVASAVSWLGAVRPSVYQHIVLNCSNHLLQ